MGHVGNVLQAVTHSSLPDRAAPVACDLIVQIERVQVLCSTFEICSGEERTLWPKRQAVCLCYSFYPVVWQLVVNCARRARTTQLHSCDMGFGG